MELASFGPSPVCPVRPYLQDKMPLPPPAVKVSHVLSPANSHSPGLASPRQACLMECQERLPFGMQLLKRRHVRTTWLAQRAVSTPAQSMYWSPRFFELTQDRLEYWAGDRRTSTSSRGIFPLDKIDEVALSGTYVTIHFSAKQITGRRSRNRSILVLCAPTPSEADQFATMLCSVTALRLSEIMNLPLEWDVSGMLQASVDGARLVAKMPLDQDLFAIVQELVDHTFLSKRTKDRGGFEMPVRLEVTEVVKVQNIFSWMAYSNTRANIAGKLNERQMPLTSEIRTSSFDHPLASTILGGLDESAAEHWLFHGSTASAVKGITNTDFRLDLAGSHKGTLYGHGLYCAECSSKADEYAEPEDGLCRMLLCRAVLGRILHDASIKPNGEELARRCCAEFDSLCGDRWAAVGTYREFVFFNTGQVYPEYVIVYRRVSQADFLTAVGAAVAGHDMPASLKLVPHALRLAEIHPDSDVRYRVSMLLSAHHEAATPVLVELLRNDMKFVRRSSASMLGHIAEYLTSSGQFGADPDAACRSMSLTAVPALQSCLADVNHGVRRAASQALACFSSHSAQAVPILLQTSHDEYAEVRQAAVAALGQIPQAADAAIPLLLQCLEDESKGVRKAATTSIGLLCLELNLGMEPYVLPRITHCLMDEDHQVRKAAAISLGLQASLAAKALPDLMNSLKDSHEEVREIAAQSIGRIGAYISVEAAEAASCAEAGRLLVDCLNDEQISVRKAAITALGLLSPYVDAAVGTLRKCLGDKKHKEVRKLSAQTLGMLGRRAGAAAMDLGMALKETDLEVRVAAAEAIGMLQDQCIRALPSLTERIKDEEIEVRRAAAAALARLGMHASPALVSLREFLNDGNAGIRQYATFAYNRIAAALGDDLDQALESGVKYNFLKKYKFSSQNMD